MDYVRYPKPVLILKNGDWPIWWNCMECALYSGSMWWEWWVSWLLKHEETRQQTYSPVYASYYGNTKEEKCGNIDIFQQNDHNINYNRYTTLTLYKQQSRNLVRKSYNNIILKQRRDRIFIISKYVFNLNHYCRWSRNPLGSRGEMIQTWCKCFITRCMA